MFFYKRCVFLCGCCPKNVAACRMPLVCYALFWQCKGRETLLFLCPLYAIAGKIDVYQSCALAYSLVAIFLSSVCRLKHGKM